MREYGKAHAVKLLDAFEMDPMHPGYPDVLKVLTDHLEQTTTRQSHAFHAIGKALLRLTDGGAVTPAAIASIRAMGEDLTQIEIGPDINALRLAVVAIEDLVTRHTTNKNLKPFKPVVTDEQILAVVDDAGYPTRQQQADKLGLKRRSLLARLKKIKK